MPLITRFVLYNTARDMYYKYTKEGHQSYTTDIYKANIYNNSKSAKQSLKILQDRYPDLIDKFEIYELKITRGQKVFL